mmetsp:Transcript_42204/g.48011  ORF Transcript_42204/g.48011 Transcript_42204/m.48011 type:complete len:94 (+) Transcript_42204:37-318(+)
MRTITIIHIVSSLFFIFIDSHIIILLLLILVLLSSFCCVAFIQLFGIIDMIDSIQFLVQIEVKIKRLPSYIHVDVVTIAVAVAADIVIDICCC